jgi:glucose-1-phosphate thymidylyltransferase
MKIIIPMAGRGTRLRPHTLTVPKPLIPIAGKAMVQRIVEDLTEGYAGQVEEIAFITGDFGKEVESELIRIAGRFGAEGRIYHQQQPLGVAHAILCAADSLHGNVFIAFSDTLFKADFQFDPSEDGIIWVKKVEDPSAFGVVKTNEQQLITDFVEKSQVFVSDLAIVGLYYVREGEYLRRQIQALVDGNVRDKGEFQITSVLENMKREGYRFRAAAIEEWLDCGNKQNIIDTNRRMLQIKAADEALRDPTALVENSVIVEPCYIGPNARISNSVIGPFVSVGNHSSIENSIIKNSVIQHNTLVQNAMFSDSMVGSHVEYAGKTSNISIGDYTSFRN